MPTRTAVDMTSFLANLTLTTHMPPFKPSLWKSKHILVTCLLPILSCWWDNATLFFFGSVSSVVMNRRVWMLWRNFWGCQNPPSWSYGHSFIMVLMVQLCVQASSSQGSRLIRCLECWDVCCIKAEGCKELLGIGKAPFRLLEKVA